ncbi:MAG: tRNA uridine-5-carboxymethylaminomethyl(34) synthesis GTPase MnmE [Methylobacteriaceae bacterium]|nr:tRNA uridine-5-carboxymethylaminomethyl(34) synthesis GTPase MnmE [Methylobacteriaceae bacterium]
MSRDTIFALSSGAGRAAVAVVRLSGAQAAAAVEALCGRRPAPRRATLTRLRSPATGEILDRALTMWLPGPASFTGEDCAEFHLHGGRAVIAGVIQALAAFPGCRVAEAGEFTRRAFFNGKMDLTAVEGLADLIEAETKAQRDQALRQLAGPLGRQAQAWRERVLQASALVEAEIDFSDEGDVGALSLPAVRALLQPVRDEIARLIDRDGRRGERLREGFVVVIAGPPNAGKSTLLNALARRDVAIVSPHAGTTRDALEVSLDLDGLPVVLVDTAGLRESQDPVEQEGVARARERARHADLVLWLEAVDELSAGPAPEFSTNTLRVATKIDRGAVLPVGIATAISALTGRGIDDLLGRLAASAAENLVGAESPLITRARHREALLAAKEALDRACAAPMDTMVELLAEDIRLAARRLGRIAGLIDTEEILREIFARFCIGK